VIKGESWFLGTLTRVQLHDPDDLPNVREVQQGFSLQPLSKYSGAAAPPPADPIAWPAWEEGAETTEAFWSYLAFLLQFVAPSAQDLSIIDDLARIGVTPDATWDPEDSEPGVRAAISNGMDDARSELVEASNRAFDPKRFFQTRSELDGATTAARSDAGTGFD
jgi:hypothetical protein